MTRPHDFLLTYIGRFKFSENAYNGLVDALRSGLFARYQSHNVW